MVTLWIGETDPSRALRSTNGFLGAFTEAGVAMPGWDLADDKLLLLVGLVRDLDVPGKLVMLDTVLFANPNFAFVFASGLVFGDIHDVVSIDADLALLPALSMARADLLSGSSSSISELLALCAICDLGSSPNNDASISSNAWSPRTLR